MITEDLQPGDMISTKETVHSLWTWVPTKRVEIIYLYGERNEGWSYYKYTNLFNFYTDFFQE